MTTPHIVILGAGFAALTAVRELRRRAPQARITLIAPKAQFVYLPSLIWVPTGIRQGKDLILPLDTFIKDHAVEFVAASVTGLEDGGRTVVTDQRKVSNDALIIATGASTSSSSTPSTSTATTSTTRASRPGCTTGTRTASSTTPSTSARSAADPWSARATTSCFAWPWARSGSR